MTSPSTADHSIADGPSSHPRADAARMLKLLTPREAQLLARLATGESLTAAAHTLGISPATARRHLHRAIRKLGVRTRAEALRLTAPPPPPASDQPRTADAVSAPEAADAPTHSPVFATFGGFCAEVRGRLVQQAFLLSGSRRRAGRCVDRALGVAGRRWGEVSAGADPEGWVRAQAFAAALSPWRRGGPRRARRRLLPRRRIRVAADAPRAEEPSGRPTAQDRALLRALLRLPRPQRHALVLHDALGRSAASVAVEVESSTVAAAARVRAARAALASEVPVLVGEDPDDPAFGERVGALLYRAALNGCPAPRERRPALLTVRGRLRAGAATGVPAVLVMAAGAAIVTTLLGVGPSAYFRPGPPAAPPVCAAGAGPAAPGRALGVRSAWCGPGPAGLAAAVPASQSGPSTAPNPADSGTPTPDQPATDQQPTGQQSTGQPTADQPPTDQQPTNQPAADRQPPSRPAPPRLSAGPVPAPSDDAAAPCPPFRLCPRDPRPSGAPAER